MELTRDKIQEAQNIIRIGKDKCLSDAEWNWAIEVLQLAFNNGYAVVKIC